MNKTQTQKQRFHYIDQFRGFIGVLMLLGHCSYYFNSIWKQLDPVDPFFSSWDQFALRYIGYLCAPGFLMMAGAMVWWAYKRRVSKGVSKRKAGWQLIQRGIFLILVQMTWVNSSWGGFSEFKPWHFGIIASIGTSVILLVSIINLKWYFRLAIAILILIVHPFLLQINYDPEVDLERIIMQTFVDSGTFNKYPVLPWFALATLGSVMASGWLHYWKSNKKKFYIGLAIAISGFILASIIRLQRGIGNISPFSDFGTYSFFLDQKYPPSLFMNIWFFSAVVLGVSIFIAINKVSPKVLMIFTIPGKVPLFFYAMHLAILGIFVKRLDFLYREGGVLETLIGTLAMLAIMLPLCYWFYGIKKKSNNYFIKMI